MKNLTRKNRTILLLTLLSLALSACGGEENSPAMTEAGQSPKETETLTEAEPDNGRSGVKDSLPSDLDFGGAEIRLLARGGDQDTLREFFSEGTNGEIINDAIYARNLSVEERLHVKLSTILTDHSRHTGFSGMVRASVQAGSDDYELIANALYDTMPMTMDGIFTDLNSLDYIDFTKPWWNAPFMEMTNYYGKNYACIGELSQSMIAGTFVMFFHKDLFKLYYPDDPSLYETVLSGGWTLDKLISYCTPMYQDLNGDGKADEGDLYGHYFTKAHTLGTDSYLGGCNIRLMSQDGAGNYVYEGLSERTASFFEKMEKLLFESNNTAMFDYNNDEIMTTMKNNQTIFTAWMLSGIELLRDMKSDFGIIPMPKLDESQKDYHTFAHDGSSAFAIPTTEEDPNRSAALLEALAAETYRTVTPAYFETALKGKYSRDSETSVMLDMIVESISLDAMCVYGSSLGEPIETFREILVNSKNCGKAMSTMASIEKSIMKNMAAVAERYEKIE